MASASITERVNIAMAAGTGGATGAIRIAGRAIATTADTGTRRRAFIAGAIIGGAIAAQPAPRAPSGSYQLWPCPCGMVHGALPLLSCLRQHVPAL